jgi:hypothetical protein
MVIIMSCKDPQHYNTKSFFVRQFQCTQDRQKMNIFWLEDTFEITSDLCQFDVCIPCCDGRSWAVPSLFSWKKSPITIRFLWGMSYPTMINFGTHLVHWMWLWWFRIVTAKILWKEDWRSYSSDLLSNNSHRSKFFCLTLIRNQSVTWQ